MSLGRIATFVVILAASVAMANALLRRAHRLRDAAVRPPSAAVRAPVSTGSVPTATASEPLALPAPPRASAEPAGGVLEDPLSDALCPAGMLLVDGTTCADPAKRCAASRSGPTEPCRRYQPAECRKGLPLRFCIDRYEYPNREGVMPAVMITFPMARDACQEEDKRLCTATEWSFACEGPRGFAFPVGDEDDGTACNVGRPAPRVRPQDLWEPRDVGPAVYRLDARVASGSQRACTSPFGVHDLIGNVEEWVASDASGSGSALRGGEYTTPAPTCRALREMRTAGYRVFHTGFRCCRDPLVRAGEPRRGRSGPTAVPPGAHLSPPLPPG